MAAPDWLHGNTDDAAGRLAGAGAHRPDGAGSPTTGRPTTGSGRDNIPATTPRPESVGCATWPSQTCEALLGLGTAVMEGCDQFFEPALLAQLDAALAHEFARQAATHDRLRQNADAERLRARLTPREREVMDLVVTGRHNREVAEALGISTRTVEVHKARLMAKLGVDNVPGLVRLSLSAGDTP